MRARKGVNIESRSPIGTNAHIGNNIKAIDRTWAGSNLDAETHSGRDAFQPMGKDIPDNPLRMVVPTRARLSNPDHAGSASNAPQVIMT